MTNKHKYVRHSTAGFILWPMNYDLHHLHVGRTLARLGGEIVSAGCGPRSIRAEALEKGHFREKCSECGRIIDARTEESRRRLPTTKRPARSAEAAGKRSHQPLKG